MGMAQAVRRAAAAGEAHDGKGGKEGDSMKKSTKALIIMLIVGTVGLAAMLGAIVGAGVLYSRETARTYEFDETPTAIVMDMKQARIELVPSDGCSVEAYVKAWRTGEIDIDDVLTVSMSGGALKIVETGFPSDFLGYFPQPYEMKVTVYAPHSALDAMGGETR
jgi:hypothetical protein